MCDNVLFDVAEELEAFYYEMRPPKAVRCWSGNSQWRRVPHSLAPHHG